MNPSTITLRREEAADYCEVESLIREAFWNLHAPGCNEHYLAHILRTSSAFVPELDIVAEADGRIIGSIMYTRSHLLTDAGEQIDTLTFGPLAVLPSYQGQGIGGQLVRHSCALAREAGCPAIFIYGDPDYYRRFGFVPAETFGIATAQNEYHPALLVCELKHGFLAGKPGRFVESDVFDTLDDAACAVFDKQFPLKELESGSPSQQRFQVLACGGKPRTLPNK